MIIPSRSLLHFRTCLPFQGPALKYKILATTGTCFSLWFHSGIMLGSRTHQSHLKWLVLSPPWTWMSLGGAASSLAHTHREGTAVCRGCESGSSCPPTCTRNVAAGASHHDLGSLKQHKFIASQLEVRSGGVSRFPGVGVLSVSFLFFLAMLTLLGLWPWHPSSLLLPSRLLLHTLPPSVKDP